MKQILAYVVLTLILCCALVTAQTREVSLDGVSNIRDDTLLMAGNTHVFSIRLKCDNTGDIYNALNGFLYRMEYTTGDRLNTAARLASACVGTMQNPGEIGGIGYNSKFWSNFDDLDKRAVESAAHYLMEYIEERL